MVVRKLLSVTHVYMNCLTIRTYNFMEHVKSAIHCFGLFYSCAICLYINCAMQNCQTLWVVHILLKKHQSANLLSLQQSSVLKYREIRFSQISTYFFVYLSNFRITYRFETLRNSITYWTYWKFSLECPSRFLVTFFYPNLVQTWSTLGACMT